VSQDVWSAQDTTPDAIEAALREMLRNLHAANQALAPARVLNLVVVVDREWKGEIANRLAQVGRYHASRTILCAVEEGRRTLDATAIMTWEDPSDGRIGVMHEQVEIDLGPSHLANLKTIVDPVVVSDLSTVLWCPNGHPEAVSSLLGLVDVILIDSDEEPLCRAAITRSVELLRSAYVVDLAWLRTTPWRERLAFSFDLPSRRHELDQIASVAVRHRPASTVSALLLAGWLASRLRWEPGQLAANDGRGWRGMAHRGRAEVEVELDFAEQDVPGLAGVTVASESGFSLALDRAPGGLCAHRHSPDGREATWQVLGASRGEGGILGEGVRQALLRDPTYAPALAAAQSFCPG
jgi:glucose-6-phosphate dehydrogenase assembly protein OpcA